MHAHILVQDKNNGILVWDKNWSILVAVIANTTPALLKDHNGVQFVICFASKVDFWKLSMAPSDDIHNQVHDALQVQPDHFPSIHSFTNH